MKNNRTRKRIFIIDDHPIVRLGLRQIISLEKDLEVCGEAAGANEAMMLISQCMPDLVTVDLSLDGDMSGLDVIKALRGRYSDIKTLVISMHEESMYMDRAIRAGANGYIPKKYAYDSIIEAINRILAGELYLSERMTSQLLQKMYRIQNQGEEPLPESLSKRELEIFRMIGSGYDTNDIAAKLGLSANTVQTYKRQIRQKLDLKNHNDLVRKATLYIKSAT